MSGDTAPSTAAPPLAPVFGILALGPDVPGLDPEVGARLRAILDELMGFCAREMEDAARSATFLYGGEHRRPADARLLVGASDPVERLALGIAGERRWAVDRILVAHAEGDGAPAVVLDYETPSRESSASELRKQALLAFSDVAIFHWDPDDERQVELANVIRAAILSHMPSIWIDRDLNVRHLSLESLDGTIRRSLVTEETEPRELTGLFVPFDRRAFARQVRRLANPLDGSATDDRGVDELAAGVHRYFAKRIRPGSPSRNAGRIDRVLSGFAGGGGVLKALLKDPTAPWYGVSAAELGLADHPILEPDGFRERFEWSDRAANVGAGNHRDSTWILHMLSALAVFAACAGAITLWVRGGSPAWTIVELAIIVVIVVTVSAGKLMNWHGEWLSHRFVAEQLRYGRMGYPFLVLPSEAIGLAPPDGTAGESGVMSAEQWLLKRTLVAAGPPRSPDGVYRPHRYGEVLRPYVCAIIQGQIDYHERTHARLHRMSHRLHQITVVAFGVTAAAVVAHFFLHAEWLLLLTAGLPAFAAALHGVSTRNEMERLSSLSAASASDLKHLKAAIEALEFAPRTAARSWLRLRRLTAESTRIMSNVAQQWQELIRHRSASLPA